MEAGEAFKEKLAGNQTQYRIAQELQLFIVQSFGAGGFHASGLELGLQFSFQFGLHFGFHFFVGMRAVSQCALQQLGVAEGVSEDGFQGPELFFVHSEAGYFGKFGGASLGGVEDPPASVASRARSPAASLPRSGFEPV